MNAIHRADGCAEMSAIHRSDGKCVAMGMVGRRMGIDNVKCACIKRMVYVISHAEGRLGNWGSASARAQLGLWLGKRPPWAWAAGNGACGLDVQVTRACGVQYPPSPHKKAATAAGLLQFAVAFLAWLLLRAQLASGSWPVMLQAPDTPPRRYACLDLMTILYAFR